MNSHLHENVESYLEIYNSLKKEFKWKIQNNIIMMIALIYAINEKLFVLKDFLELSDYIKDNTSYFSTLHSHQKFTTAAMLIAKFDNPKKAFHDLLKFQDNLIDLGFKNGPYTVIAALALMTTSSDNENLDMRINKAMKIYKAMKSYHLFLTSQSDYPLAVLLSQSELPVDVLMEEVEFYYSNLAQGTFKKGNELQFLSHILMLTNTENKAIIIDRCNNLYQEMIKSELKIKRFHYPLIGLMAIVDRELDEEILLIKDLANRFNSTKGLGASKSVNLSMSILLVMTSLIKNLYEDITIVETGINTSIEALVQAQSAALVASISAATVTTTTIS